MYFESSIESRDMEAETRRTSLDLFESSTLGVDKEIPISDGSKGSWNHPQSSVLALRDLYISDSQECDDQSRVSAERAVLNFEAEASRETMVTAGISSPVSHQSSLSAESIEGNFEAEASEATMEDVEVSSRMLPPAKNVGFWKYPQSPFSTLEFNESDSHEGDNSTLPAESGKTFLHVEPQTSIATTGAVRPGKSISSLFKIPEFVNPELNVDLNCDTDLDGRLYSGYCCAYCVRALNRCERLSYIYNLKCTRLVSKDEKEKKDDEILKEDYRFKYLTHRCDVQKSTTPSDSSDDEENEMDLEILQEDDSFYFAQHRRNVQKWSPPPKKVHCYLCLQHFECVFAFECHVISQHKRDVIVLCFICQEYRTSIETFGYKPISGDSMV